MWHESGVLEPTCRHPHSSAVAGRLNNLHPETGFTLLSLFLLVSTVSCLNHVVILLVGKLNLVCRKIRTSIFYINLGSNYNYTSSITYCSFKLLLEASCSYAANKFTRTIKHSRTKFNGSGSNHVQCPIIYIFMFHPPYYCLFE